MGKFYYVKCTHCGYSFRAIYGGGRSYDGTLILKRTFEEGKAEKGLQGIFDALKNTVTEREDRHNQELVIRNTSQTEEELQKELFLFKAPRISAPWYVYECSKCKKLFTHKRIRMMCDKGMFEERYIECPTCGDLHAAPVDEKDFHRKNPENTEMSVCDVECPICNENLIVLKWGFWD